MNCKGPILLCRCAEAKVLSAELVEKAARLLAKSGREFFVVDDLCRLAAGRYKILKELAEKEGLIVAACFPRAIRWLFNASDAPLGSDIKLLNLRTEDTDKLESELLQLARTDKKAKPANADRPISRKADKSADSWVPWFPVIDRDRCRNCKQCMNFCLFGVYGLDDAGKVRVVKPRACKTNCPACARMCPFGAIIFPKFDQPPINGEEVPADWKAPEESGKIAGMSREKLMEALKSRGAFTDVKPGESEDAG